MPTPHAHDPAPDYAFCPRCAAALGRRVLRAGEPERLVCPTCAFVFFLDPKLAAGCIFEVDGGIVLLRRAIAPAVGKWVFPGGYVDRGEAVSAAAAREVLEEVCLRVAPNALLGVYSYPGRPIVVVVYTATVLDGTLACGDEALEVRAFAPAALPWDDLAFTSTYDALADYIDRFHTLRPPPHSHRPPAP